MAADCQKTKILLHCAYDMWIEHRKAYGSKLDNAAMESQSLNEKFAFHLLELHTLCNSCFGPPGESVSSGPRLCPAAPAPSAEVDSDMRVPAMNMDRELDLESPGSILEPSISSKCRSSINPHSASASVRQRFEASVHRETSPAMKSKTPSPGGASPGKRIRLDQPSESDELYQVLNIKEEEHEDWAEDAGTNEQPTDLESPTSDQYLDDDINQDDYLQMVAESVYVGSHMGSMPNNKRKQALQRSRYSTLTKQMDLQVSDVDSNQELLQVQQKRMKQATIHNLSFDVEHILRTNALGGAALVDKMKRQRTIDRSGNRLFVQTLVSNLIANYGYNPSPDIKAALAQSIIDQFEFLGDKNGVTGYEQWFVRGKRNLPATGSLEARLRYIRRVHFPRETKRKPADHQREYSVSSKAKKTRVDPTILPEVHEDEVKEATMWMKQNREPKAKVEEYMRTTCKHRYDWIRAENPPTIAEVLDRYPRLLDPGIIDADYRQAISEKTADNLYANWPRIAPRILQYADLQEVKWRKELGMENSNSSELCEEEQQMLAFSILPFLFMGRCKDKSGRCSAVNSLKAFIDHISESTDMPQYLTETGVTERPPVCILTHGGTRWKPQQTFVILEHRPVPCSSLIQAVDVCFKAIYILDIEYHPHTCSVMEFLQHIIYGIPPGSLVRRALISFRTWFNN